jgi:putative hemolysin
MMKQAVIVTLVLTGLVIAACTPLLVPQAEPPMMPNPASQHCVDEGGTLEIRDEAGGQVGYCVFDDGSECEEWAFYRGECIPGGSYQPLDSNDCAELARAMAKTVGVKVVTEEAAFEDYLTGQSGVGCQVTATGTGGDFQSPQAVATALGEMLEALGMREDVQYAADGPTGTARAFRKENRLCLMQVGWNPSKDADCPQDQPVTACDLTPEQQAYTIVLNCAQTPPSLDSPTGLPNPASQYCEEQGGKLEIRDEAGGQVGYCIFPDGSECEEWAFYRGECAPGGQDVGMPNPASQYCEEQGGKLEIRDEAGGQVGYCIFPDGSECEEWAFYRGECAPGAIKSGSDVMPEAEGDLAQAEPAPSSAQDQPQPTSDLQTPPKVVQYGDGYRFDQNGWIYLHIEGEPYQRGFQHGYLLAPELAEILGNFKGLTYWETGKEWEFFVEAAVAQFAHRIDPEYLSEIQGIAHGARAAGTDITWQEVLTWNGYEELLGYWWPNELAGKYAQPDNDHCSGFIATGSVTKDGKIVMAHNSWDAFTHGQYFNVILDIEPAQGHRMFMQSSPGYIASFTDFFVTDAGIMGTETTIGGYSEYDPDEDPEFFRIRKAMQYADTLDELVQLMEKKNNGGYANSWLLADINTGEIMRFELGLQYQNVERTKDGYFVGFNAAEDPRIRNLETSDSGYDDVRTPMGARRVRLTQLMEEHYGEIDVEAGKEILADHYDVYLQKENPGSRTVEGHYELDAFEYWPARLPYAPQGAVDGKVMDSTMAQDLSFWARWGSSSGMPFDVDKHVSEHPQWQHLAGYLKDRPTQPWTLFSAGERQAE